MELDPAQNYCGWRFKHRPCSTNFSSRDHTACHFAMPPTPTVLAAAPRVLPPYSPRVDTGEKANTISLLRPSLLPLLLCSTVSTAMQVHHRLHPSASSSQSKPANQTTVLPLWCSNTFEHEPPVTPLVNAPFPAASSSVSSSLMPTISHQPLATRLLPQASTTPLLDPPPPENQRQ
jgi:hypothetical protein